ncbi:heat-inducible transcriptional repressor HrcA [Gulosibacter molinativorax]|uniref:Heat-inducible transcription repressor HrcA n=1 Tax=Gulosibacter molinativorax TaxID=256821 RepID=A0ABT7C561_9MICO|nr:heat-inducible transcriptional repressor HrcA [Gulosibacter molinativorax]MDJ1369826.1 heat-inducible transcriptional repressor HrcA [Gulosibacter molinativorax]
MVSERSLDVLRAIIGDYVETKEPVGSKRLVERHKFGVSAATIRNDMAQLEEAELITAPHTSSGRIPTDKGYRVFVDRLSGIRPLTTAQRRAIEDFMERSSDPEELVVQSVRTLAQLTNSVAIGQLPSLLTSSIHRLELVSLSDRRILTVLITDSGRVEQRIVEIESEIDEDTLVKVRQHFNETLVGHSLQEAAKRIDDLTDPFTGEEEVLASQLVNALIDQLNSNREDRLIIAGAANLARTERDFSSILPVLEAMEEQVVLLRLVAELDLQDHEVAVSIGHENEEASFEETSILASGYMADRGEARLGILGPTRMDYRRNIAAVRAVARYLSRVFNDTAA